MALIVPQLGVAMVSAWPGDAVRGLGGGGHLWRVPRGRDLGMCRVAMLSFRSLLDRRCDIPENTIDSIADALKDKGAMACAEPANALGTVGEWRRSRRRRSVFWPSSPARIGSMMCEGQLVRPSRESRISPRR